MISSYEVGYFSGRITTKILKVYLTGRFLKTTYKKACKWAKKHKIDETQADIVTQNVFDSLQYID